MPVPCHPPWRFSLWAAETILLCAGCVSAQTFRMIPAATSSAPFRLTSGSDFTWPFTPTYKADTTLRTSNADSYPAMIVYPARAIDVVNAFAYAKNNNLQVTVKGTGHDYQGRCSGDGTLNVNMKLMNKVLNVDTKANTVTFQAGADFGLIQGTLVPRYGRVVVTGQLTSVGPGGCLAGGCHGPLSRQHGLGADNVLSVVLVNPQGKVVHASKDGVHEMSLTAAGDVAPALGKRITGNTSLLWALRGGGGGRWGVVLQMTLRTFPAPKVVSSLTVGFQITSTETGTPVAQDILARYLLNAAWWRAVPNTISAPAIVGSVASNGVSATFVYAGDTPAELLRTPALLDLIGEPRVAVLAANNFSSYLALMEALTPADDGIQFKRQVGLGNIFLGLDQMTPAVVNGVVAALARGTDAPSPQGFGMWCVMGGAMTKHPEAARTSVGPGFRNAVCELAVGTPSLNPTFDTEVALSNQQVLQPLFELSNASYVNEFSWQPGTTTQPVPDWQSRFWGGNYARLLQIQQSNDPERRMYTPIYSVGWEAPKQ